MDAMEFADRYLRPYKIKGDEVIPQYCPLCKGGVNRDKETFALNIEKQAYHCLRGSCERSGTFRQLCRELGAEQMPIARTGSFGNREKSYSTPKTQVQMASQQAYSYLESRGISRSSADHYKIGCDEKGNIVFPFHENGQLVFVKFRPARGLQPGEHKAWRESKTKPVLFGMDECDSLKPLCIFEGEIDALSGYEAGIPNCVSVPSGCEDMEWIELCWDWLHRFERIYFFGDSDGPGREMIRKAACRLSDIDTLDVVHEGKDANELLTNQGRHALLAAYEKAEEILPLGLINLADVQPLDIKNIPSCSSGIKELDRMIGGFIMGDLSVWTGRRGEGKSTLLGQLMLEAIDAGERVCVYSGEMGPSRFQYWINLQAAGPECITVDHDSSQNRDIHSIDYPILSAIREWYRGKFFLYDKATDGDDEDTNILRVFETAARRYGCTVFLVDNLMTCSYRVKGESDYYRAQSTFVGQLVEFARRLNVHVHLIAHPRKTERGIENEDVSGSGDITNRAANVFSLELLKDEERKKTGCDSMLKILKNRWEGSVGKIGLNYCPTSRRLYLPSQGNTRKYGWKLEQVEITDEHMPF